MRWAVAVVRTFAGAVLVAPHEGADGLTVEGDCAFGGADGRVLEAGASPPGTRDVCLVSVGGWDLRDRAGQLRLIGDALTDDRAVVECEGE